MTIDEQMRLVVGRRLKADFDNGRSYYQLNGTELALPVDAARRPDQVNVGPMTEGELLLLGETSPSSAVRPVSRSTSRNESAMSRQIGVRVMVRSARRLSAH